MTDVLTVASVGSESLAAVLDPYGLELKIQASGEEIAGSFWGESEAGVLGHSVVVRSDTPVHSFLHETSHIICMDSQRRDGLLTDAGGDDLEECAVCYLQILLADFITGAGRDRIMADMDSWGYSFRLGNTRDWFEQDAQDAQKFLLDYGLMDSSGKPLMVLRS